MTTPENLTDLAGGVIRHYQKHACDWDADRRAAVWNDRPWHDRFIAALPSNATVLDLGCGAGSPVALHMVERGLRVTCVDASTTLIALCRDRMPNQSWVVGDMRSVSLGQKFDGVLAWDSFFHLKPDDQRCMFDVFAAHTAPAGVLMFNTGPAHGEGIGRYRGDPLYHASLDAAEYRTLLAKSGCRVVAHAVADWQAGGGRTVWLARSASRVQPFRRFTDRRQARLRPGQVRVDE